MTINFALSLSVEGIELLHRVQGGWRRLGATSIDSTTLDADLIELRQKALTLAPEGITTKLIIPRDQIKYTAIDSTLTDDSDIHAALDGTTPYALDELVIDCERFGGRTHIAAVARETLAEAEGFATAHGFNPVAFVAIPEPFTFQKEVFFGPTDVMPSILGATGSVAADDLPVMIAGTRLKSRLLIMDAVEEPSDEVAAFLAAAEAASDTAEVATPAEVGRAQQTIWVDRVPAEVVIKARDVVVAPTPEPAPAVVILPQTQSFAALPLYDAVIAEFHAGTRKRAKPALVAHSGMARAPRRSASPVAPARAAKPVAAAKPAPRTALIAAGIALAVVGGVIFARFSAGQPETAVEIAQEAPIVTATAAPAPLVQPALEAGPDIPDFTPSTFGSVAAPGTVPDPVRPSFAPVIAEAPEMIATATSEVSPLIPQEPAAPPEEDVIVETTPATGVMPSPAEAERFYAATGVWQRAPRLIDTPSGAIPLGFKRPAGTQSYRATSAPSISLSRTPQAEVVMTAPIDPPAADAVFARDEDGFVLATPEGTITPDGAIVFAGLPDINFNPRPTLSEDDLARMQLLAPAPDGVILIAGRPDYATPLRPDDLVVAQPQVDTEPQEDTSVTAGSVGLASLEIQETGALGLDTETIEARANNDLRPQLRPQGLVAITAATNPDITDILTEVAAEDATLRFDNSTNLAVRQSIRPTDRPGNFGAIVAAAQAVQINTIVASAAPAPAPAAAPVQAAAPVAPQNTGPVPGGVARAATIDDAIRLREINLIGVYGRSNARRALVRLSNGRYVRVEVGSDLDGGQVTAIGDTALNYVKRGRTYAIELPSG